jgi:transposase InsO family protein
LPNARRQQPKSASSGKIASAETLHWIGFYNEERLHEELGDVPPAEYEMITYKRDNIRTLSAR